MTLPLASLTLLLACALALLLFRPGKRAGGGKALPAADVSGPGASALAVSIFFGTQTGTAERFAKELSAELVRRYPSTSKPQVVDLDKVHAANALEHLSRTRHAIFLQATYGDGEPTDGAAAFCKWAAECGAGGGRPLAGLTVAVFGLGNRQYEHFNAAAKKLDGSLAAAGATRMCDLCLGDDDGSLEDDFESWRNKQLWPGLERAAPSILGSSQDAAQRRASEDAAGAHVHEAYDVAILPSTPGGRLAPTPPATPIAQRGASANGSAHHWDAKHPFTARLSARRELHTGGDRSCVHCELDVSGGGPVYETGDHVGILAENSPAVVDHVLRLLCQRGDMTFTLSRRRTSLDAQADGGSVLPEPFAGPVRLDAALARFADVLNPPKRSVFAALASIAASHDAGSAAKLSHLASSAGKDAYAAYVTQVHRSLVEVLDDFPGVAKHIPLGTFFACIAPRLAPRYYSISSSSTAYPTTVHVTAAVVRGPTPTGRIHEGVCTTWLARLPLGSAVQVFIRSSGFRLPKAMPSAGGAAQPPVVMIGPGTGVAPFRAFVQERAHLLSAGQTGPLGAATLFFGCRAPDVDFIYRQELETAAQSPALDALHVAFSRVSGQPKVYVQHLLASHGDDVYKALVTASGHLYVCGDAKAMAKDVHKALLDLLQTKGRMSVAQAEAYAARMQTEGRYMRDVWAQVRQIIKKSQGYKFFEANKVPAKDLERCLDIFMEGDPDGSGSLSYARFAALARLNHNDPHCLHLCQTFDATGNGDIDIREFIYGLSKFHDESFENEVHFAFGLFDLDGSGRLEEHEALLVMRDAVRSELTGRVEESVSHTQEMQLRHVIEDVLKQTGKDSISITEFAIICNRAPRVYHGAKILYEHLSKLSKSPHRVITALKEEALQQLIKSIGRIPISRDSSARGPRFGSDAPAKPVHMPLAKRLVPLPAKEPHGFPLMDALFNHGVKPAAQQQRKSSMHRASVPALPPPEAEAGGDEASKPTPARPRSSGGSIGRRNSRPSSSTSGSRRSSSKR